MENNLIVFEDVSYGDHERQKFDIFIPKNVKSQNGIMLFVHGGGWHEGDKEIRRADAQYFCNLGYICATMNYRFVCADVNVFDELDDISSALMAIKQKCGEYGFNIEKVLLSGGSAGAHLSLLYAYTRKGETPVTPVCVCAYCPPVSFSKPDFLNGISEEFDDWKYGLISNCCGFKVTKTDLLKELPQEALKRISPEEYVSEECVPTAVFHGEFDELIPLAHIKSFVALLNKKGVANDFLIYENSSHLLEKDSSVAQESKNIINKYAEMYF